MYSVLYTALYTVSYTTSYVAALYVLLTLSVKNTNTAITLYQSPSLQHIILVEREERENSTPLPMNADV